MQSWNRYLSLVSWPGVLFNTTLLSFNKVILISLLDWLNLLIRLHVRFWLQQHYYQHFCILVEEILFSSSTTFIFVKDTHLFQNLYLTILFCFHIFILEIYCTLSFNFFVKFNYLRSQGSIYMFLYVHLVFTPLDYFLFCSCRRGHDK